MISMQKHCEEMRGPSLGTSKFEEAFKLVIAIGMWLTPISSVFWGWRYWYLRPLVFYMSVMPNLPLWIAIVFYLPWALLSLVGIEEKFRPIFELVLADHLWPAYMRIMHGFEMTGLENLPVKDKGALIVFYHGVMPFDVLFAGVAIYHHCKRFLEGTAHKFSFSVPVVGRILTEIKFSAAGRDKMISDLRNGSLKCVSPGGLYEATFSENYSMDFQGRFGFAVVAREANVPVIPMFTENVREYQRVHFFGLRGVFKWLYQSHRFQPFWAFGGWPVKLRSHLGKPMWIDENETPQEFALRVRKALEELRDTYQKLDNSVLRALLERLPRDILPMSASQQTAS